MKTYEIKYRFEGTVGTHAETVRATSYAAALAIFGTCPAQRVISVNLL